jgi:ferredoxin
MRLLRNSSLLLILLFVAFLAGCSDSLSKLSVAGNVPPAAISNLETLLVNDTVIQVIWDIPADDYLDHYEVYLCPNDSASILRDSLYTNQLQGFKGQQKQGISLRNLIPDTDYKVAVVSANVYGSSYGIMDSLIIHTALNHTEDSEAPSDPIMVNITPFLAKGSEAIFSTDLVIEFTPSGSNELITPELRYSTDPVNASWDTAFPIYNPDIFIPECLSGNTASIRINPFNAFGIIPWQGSNYQFILFAKSKDIAGNNSAGYAYAAGVLTVEVQSGCIKCWNCIGVCPENAISRGSSKAIIDLNSCTRCGNCVIECASSAARVIFFKTQEIFGAKK